MREVCEKNIHRSLERPFSGKSGETGFFAGSREVPGKNTCIREKHSGKHSSCDSKFI